jgi:3D (Asp-Asp-Asp) domain-containing protein
MKYILRKFAGSEDHAAVVKRRLLPAAVLVGIFLLLVPKLYMSAATQTKEKSTCSDGWYITGYYVPREDELPGTAEQIEVERVGTLSFSQEFLNETRTEGWGVTRFGWALGYHSGGWHRSDAGPLDAAGNVLTDGAIAVDRSVIPPGAQVQISTLPDRWASKILRATDIGVGITGQHIDVFTGTGNTAQQETFRITSNNNRVCVTSNATGDVSRYAP